MSARSCVVTGAAGGIGRGIVVELLRNGWHVVGVDLESSDPQEASGVPEAIVSEKFRSVVGDVADPESHARAADAAETLAPLDGWVNCAGYNILGTVADLSIDDLTRGISVDLFGVFFGTGEAVRRMLAKPKAERNGSIVNISSMQASVGFPNFAAYAMAKGGIESLTRQVAGEYVTEAIRCNAVAPGLIASPMNESLMEASPESELLLRRWKHITPMGRWGTAQDVASAVRFLLGDEAAYITGHVLPVNGGALTIAPGQLPE